MTPSSAQYLFPGLIAIAVATAALPAQAEESGFVEGAKATLNLRNFYINRNFTNPANPQSKAEEWTQSFILDAKSGFTQGPVGFGVDVLGLLSVKLDGGKGTRRHPAAADWQRRSTQSMTLVVWRWPGR